MGEIRVEFLTSLSPSLCSVCLSYLSPYLRICIFTTWMRPPPVSVVEFRSLSTHSAGTMRTSVIICSIRSLDHPPPSLPCLSHLFLKGIEPSFYSLRWMTTLFSREFDVLDTIRLWDSYLAETCREELITYLCCTMVLEQKDQLLKGDFGENLSLVPDLTSLCLCLSFPRHLSLLPSSLAVATEISPD
jgi:hypothetical protein